MSQKCLVTFCQLANLQKPASVTFFPNYCVSQDLTSGKMIGCTKERNGLYYLDTEEGGTIWAYQIKGTTERFLECYWLMHTRD